MMRAILAALCLACAVPVLGYERQTHEELSIRGLNASAATLNALPELGLEPGSRLRGERRTAVGPRNFTLSIGEWLRAGAHDEDDTLSATVARYLNHFFDPTPGAPNGGGLAFGLITGMPAPDWSLETPPNPGQFYSYPDARTYLFNGLTQPSAADRESNLALAFYALGHVVHVIQDLAQPQHTRNDSHGTGSLYEQFTNDMVLGRELRYALTYGGGPVPAFPVVRELWLDQARFTNRNFVSDGTNFRFAAGAWLPSERYADPQPHGDTEVVNIAQLPGIEQDLVDWCGGLCLMRFTASKAQDSSLVIPRAATYSIFTRDLSAINAGPLQVSLNRYNFLGAQQHLIPRAVSYTTGLLDYFFRGRIDLRRDEDDPAKFRIVNLGAEAMSGRFALYYDAKDGKRYPVTVDASDPSRDADGKAWRLSIAAAGPANPNGTLSAPVSFVPPAIAGLPTDPKEPNEYLLVFSGDMGEERADPDNEVVGAVAAKLVAAPYNGVLYVVGVDANGQRVALRWDKSGTRVVPADEFHPLRNVTMPPHYQALDKGYVTKQVVFKQHTFGWSYETLAATVGIHFPFYGNFATGWVKNSDTGAYEIVGGVVWKAKSPDPAIGEFRFRPIVPESNPATATLEYRRTYTDGAGNRQTVTGNIALPAPIGNWNYLLFPQGHLFVSGDGLAVSGFYRGVDTPGANPYRLTMEDYDLRITLAEVPTVGFVKTGERLIHTLGTQNLPFTSTVIGQISVTACDPPVTGVGDIVRTQYAWDRTYMLDETHWIDYLNGGLRSYRRLENARQIFSHDSTAGSASAGAEPCRRVKFHAVGEDKDTLAVDGGFIFGNGSLVTQIRSNRSGHSFPGLPSANRTWQLDYEGAPPVPPIPYVSTAGPESSQSHWVYRAITDRVEDAVYEVQETGRLWFRSHDITDKVWYIGESSPLGEVFFATADRSIVVHEPKRGAPIVIPPNVVRLLAAVWM